MSPLISSVLCRAGEKHDPYSPVSGYTNVECGIFCPPFHNLTARFAQDAKDAKKTFFVEPGACPPISNEYAVISQMAGVGPTKFSTLRVALSPNRAVFILNN